MLAIKMGIDPFEFRRLNAIRPGQTKGTGNVAEQWPFVELCDVVKPHYDRAVKDAKTFNAKGGKIRRGVGVACHAFGNRLLRRSRTVVYRTLIRMTA